MKMHISIEVDASRSILETIERTGFKVCLDNGHTYIEVPNAPMIPSRKMKIQFTREDAINGNDSAECKGSKGRIKAS